MSTPSSSHWPHWPGDKVNVHDPAVQRWRPSLYGAGVVYAPLMHVDLAQLVDFHTAWLAIESGGNVCAVGNKYKTIPPGDAPQEIGLWQIYNPDDFKALGIDPLELVAYCVRPAPGHVNPQQLAHPMTDEQIGRLMDVGMKFVRGKREYAMHYLAASGATWPSSSPDTWRMTKAVHALPVLVNTGLGQVTRRLGRAPISWAEYRQTYQEINPRAKYDPEKDRKGSPTYGQEQDGYYRALNNAEWTGGMVGQALATS